MNDGSRLEKQVEKTLRDAGLHPQRQMKIAGARSTHMFDVVVEVTSLSMVGRWLIECKDWTTPVKKEVTRAFCAAVEDVGADKGIMVAASGYQKGCWSEVGNRNVELLTLHEFESSLADEVALTRLRVAQTRLAALDSLLESMHKRGTLHPGERFRRGFAEHFPTGPGAEHFSDRRSAVTFLVEAVDLALAGKAMLLPDLDYVEGDEAPPDDWYPSYRVRDRVEYAAAVDALLADWEPWSNGLVPPD
jgi:hypothetical protein